MHRYKVLTFVLIAVLIVLSFNSVSIAQGDSGGGETTNTLESTVCCEKTQSGLYCQNAAEDKCDPDFRMPPTACESTLFCSTGWCYDSQQGTCMDNTPEVSCDFDGGTWSAEKPAQCELGCCVLGDEAAYVTQVRCNYLAGDAGLETNWDPSVTDANVCLEIANSADKGACVYEDIPGRRTCKMTTRGECSVENMYNGGSPLDEIPEETPQVGDDNGLVPVNSASQNQDTVGDESSEEGEGTTPPVAGGFLPFVTAQDSEEEGEEPEVTEEAGMEVEFYAGTLCSDDSLGTNCAPTRNTICQDGKEEVYFVDTCGNPANIYDAGRVNDDTYWSEIITKEESCNPNSNNEDNQACGNCNYLTGSYCREASEVQPAEGNYICQSLNCVDTDGNERLHGESWCAYDGGVENNPGSRFYRQLCVNGDIQVEPCSDYRQEECIEDSSNGLSQAQCRVNRWQDCTAQRDQETCENSDRRDCRWLSGIQFVLMGSVLNGSTVDGNSLGQLASAVEEQGGLDNIPQGACVPEVTPGLNLESEEATGICGQANAVCPVKYTKGLLDDEWECSENCECLPGGWLEAQRAQLCTAIADCGPKSNFIGEKGSGKGYDIQVDEQDDDD